MYDFSAFNLISCSFDARFRLKRNHAHSFILTRYVFIIFGFYFLLDGFHWGISFLLTHSLSLSLSLDIISSLSWVLYSHMQYKVHLVTVYIACEFYSGAWNRIWYSTSYSTHNDKGQKWIIDITMVHTEKEISSRQ